MPDAIELFDQGVTHLKARELDLAIEFFSEAIALDPGLAAARHGRGVSHALEGDLAQGIADCTEAIRLDRGNPLFYRARGRIFQEAGQKSQAESDLVVDDRLHEVRRPAKRDASPE